MIIRRWNDTRQCSTGIRAIQTLFEEIVDYVFLSQNGIAHEEVDIIHRLGGGQHAENEYVSFQTGTQQHHELC